MGLGVGTCCPVVDVEAVAGLAVDPAGEGVGSAVPAVAVVGGAAGDAAPFDDDAAGA